MKKWEEEYEEIIFLNRETVKVYKIILDSVIVILAIIRILSPPIEVIKVPNFNFYLNISIVIIVAVTILIYNRKICRAISQPIVNFYENIRIPQKIEEAFTKRKLNDFKSIIYLLREIYNTSITYSFQKVLLNIDEKSKINLRDDFLSDMNNISIQLSNLSSSNELIYIKDELQHIITQKIEKSIEKFNEKIKGIENYDTNKMENLITAYDIFIAKLNAFYTNEQWQSPPFCLLRCKLSNRIKI